MDSHAHIDFFDSERLGDCLREAREVGVDYFVVPGVSRKRWPQLTEVAQHKNVFFALGEHPLELADASEIGAIMGNLSEEVEKINITSVVKKLVAIGEIGLDYYHLKENDLEGRRFQGEAFREQLSVAVKKSLPVIIHCRDRDGFVDAWNDTILSIENCGISPENVLFHCFSYGPEQVKMWCKRGGYVSLSGTVTRPNAEKSRAALPFIPPEQMLIETDSPFLLPHALRVAGRDEQPANEPKNVVEVARVIGGVLGKRKEEILAKTLENGLRFFRIK
ncbi:MAG: TatD family hydrolase [Puniceicoccales bacterium]|jgi:TatD DNase family protein|nr:TatD family hydrolase [Puniceicoccales bacterium]